MRWCMECAYRPCLCLCTLTRLKSLRDKKVEEVDDDGDKPQHDGCQLGLEVPVQEESPGQGNMPHTPGEYPKK